MDEVRLQETEDLDLIESMAGDHDHVNRPASHPNEKTHFLAMRDGEVIGCGWTRVLMRKIGVIGGMYIEESFRGQGLGEELFDALCERLRRQRCWLVLLGVHRDNKPAISLYRKKGFMTVLPWLPGFGPDSKIGDVIEHVFNTPPPPRSTKIMVARL